MKSSFGRVLLMDMRVQVIQSAVDHVILLVAYVRMNSFSFPFSLPPQKVKSFPTVYDNGRRIEFQVANIEYLVHLTVFAGIIVHETLHLEQVIVGQIIALLTVFVRLVQDSKEINFVVN